MAIETKIINLIEAPLNGLGYELVRIKQIDQDTLQIMIDSDSGVNIEDCTKATKLIKRILQVAEISDDFALEISSPGIERPLIKPEHFIKCIGKDVKINTQKLIDGQKRFAGKLTGFDKENNNIELTCENKIVQISLEQVQTANLHYKK